MATSGAIGFPTHPMNRRFFSTCLLIAAASVACRNTRMFEVPPPIHLQASEATGLREVIVEAMKRRKPIWRIVTEDLSSKTMRVELVHRTHIALADIQYGGSEITFSYVRGANLKESPKDVSIHKAYNSWLANLRNDIEDELRIVRT